MADLGLVSTELLDCHGRVTHRLVLELDGNVRIEWTGSGTAARVDPHRGRCLTPGMHIDHQLMSAARGLRPG